MKKLIHLKHNLNAGKILAMLCLVLMVFCLPASDAVAQTSYELARREGNVTVTNVSRAQLQAMPHNQLRETLLNTDFFKITDLANATSVQLSQRQENVNYLTVDQFNQASIDRKIHVILHPMNYAIVAEAAMIPKNQISRAYLNTLSSEKKQALLASGNFIIVD